MSELVLPRREERRLLLTRGPGASPARSTACSWHCGSTQPASSVGRHLGEGSINGAGGATPLSKAHRAIYPDPEQGYEPPPAPRSPGSSAQVVSAAGQHGVGSCSQRCERRCHGGTWGRPPARCASTVGRDGPWGGEIWGRDGQQGRGGLATGAGREGRRGARTASRAAEGV